MNHLKGASMDTLAVHAGISDHEFHPVVPPIYQTSTFSFENAEHGAALFAGDRHGYIYTRMGNPTVEALERCIAALEGGYRALACSSGMAAIHTCLVSLLKTGDHIVCSDAVYGPTCTLIEDVLGRFGVTATFVDTANLAAVRRAIQDNTRAVYVETPGNPTLVISDIEAIARIAHDAGAWLVVDNTFMGPALQRPIGLGADVVIHSLTKSLNGHADVVGGAIVATNEESYLQFRKTLNQLGGVLSPLEAFLVHRGIKTLTLHVRRQTESALRIARFLARHPSVDWVRYPGLIDHPQYEVARRQMVGGGGLISFGLRGGLEAGRLMINSVRLCVLAVSLGGVETLIQHPATMTHASMGREARRRAHITDGLVRLSVGIEDVDEIIADLKRGLDRVVAAQPRPARVSKPNDAQAGPLSCSN